MNGAYSSFKSVVDIFQSLIPSRALLGCPKLCWLFARVGRQIKLDSFGDFSMQAITLGLSHKAACQRNSDLGQQTLLWPVRILSFSVWHGSVIERPPES
jgi:hypothetical protein